jgi:hypothetical protein
VRVYRCASHSTTLVVAHEYMAPSELSKLTMNSRHAETDSDPLEVSKKKPDYNNTARSFCMSILIRSGGHFSPLRSLLLMSCLVIGSFRPFSLLTLPIMLSDATKPSHLTPFSRKLLPSVPTVHGTDFFWSHFACH